MDKTTIYLEPRMVRTLRRLARDTGRSQATIIREAIAEYIARPARTDLDGFVGCVDSGDPGLAGRARSELRAMAAAGELDDR